MSTVSWHPATHIGRNNPQFSPLRTTVETAFYANHMTPLTDIAQTYELAKALQVPSFWTDLSKTPVNSVCPRMRKY